MNFSRPATPSDEHGHVASEGKGEMEPHNLVGPPLVLGFLLMLLIDQCSGGHRKPGSKSDL